MNIHNVIALVATVLYLSLFLVIVFNRSWQELRRLFVMYLAAAALWSFSDFLMRSDSFAGYSLLLFRLVIFFSLWFVLQLYYFVRSFLHLPAGWGVWFGYMALVTFGIVVATGYAPPSITFSNGVVKPAYGWWFILYAVPIVTLTGLGLDSLWQRLRISTDPAQRNKIAYLIIAIVLLAVFGYTGATPLARGYAVTHVGAALSASILAYAVMKHELISINSVLRRVLGWASLFVMGAGAYLLIFFLLHLLIGFEIEAVTLTLGTLIAAAVALFVYWLRPVFLGIVDQLIYRGTYPYRQALLGFNSKMGNIINLSEVANEMLPTISKALRTPQARLLFEDVDSGDFTTQFTFPKTKDSPTDGIRFGSDNPIVAWLEKEAVPLDLRRIDTIPQLKGLWQAEREELAASNLRLLCPIKSRGKLIGILALGSKPADSAYSHEDIETVMSMASQAGIIIENARLFDSLKTQRHQVEQLLTQAVQAQEEERERISIDLHDSVAQWLVAASYRAQTATALLTGGGNDRTRNELAGMESTLDKSVKELRRVVVGLRPPALDELGLSHALRQSFEELKADGVVCRFSGVGKSLRLPPTVEIAVYRVVQESINNIRKHANASKANLRLQFQEDKLIVEIRDNGRGFDLSQTMASAISVGHMGLLGMKQRAEMMGGDIRIKTGEGAGTTITLSLPIQSPTEET